MFVHNSCKLHFATFKFLISENKTVLLRFKFWKSWSLYYCFQRSIIQKRSQGFSRNDGELIGFEIRWSKSKIGVWVRLQKDEHVQCSFDVQCTVPRTSNNNKIYKVLFCNFWKNWKTWKTCFMTKILQIILN